MLEGNCTRYWIHVHAGKQATTRQESAQEMVIHLQDNENSRMVLQNPVCKFYKGGQVPQSSVQNSRLNCSNFSQAKSIKSLYMIIREAIDDFSIKMPKIVYPRRFNVTSTLLHFHSAVSTTPTRGRRTSHKVYSTNLCSKYYQE